MNGNNKKATTLLVTLGFFMSLLAVFGTPVGATSGRAGNFNVTVGLLNATGGPVTQGPVGVLVNITVNCTQTVGIPNQTGVLLNCTINDVPYGAGYGPFNLNNTTPPNNAYNGTVISWTPQAFKTYTINLTARNGTDINVSNVTVTSVTYTALASNFSLDSVTADKSAALVGVDTVTITAVVNNTGNMADVANVSFKVGTVTLGFVTGNVLAGATGNVVIQTNFTGLGLTDGNYTVQAQLVTGSPAPVNTANITLTNPVAYIMILGIDLTPTVGNHTVKKGETLEVMVDCHIKNTGTASAPNATAIFYMDDVSGSGFTTVTLEKVILAGAEDYITAYYNFTGAQVGDHKFSCGIKDRETGDGWFTTENFTIVGATNVTFTNFTLSVASGLEGDNVTMTAKLANDANMDATGVDVAFVVGTTTVGTKTNLTIAKSATLDVTFVYTLPNVTATLTQQASAKIGTLSSVGTNLTIVKKVAVYEVITFSVPADTWRVGDKVTLQATVKNNGTGDGTGVIVDFYDGTTKLNSSAAFNLTKGSSNTVNVMVELAGVEGNHTFYAKVGTVEKNATKLVLHKLSVAAITIGNFTVAPKLKDKQVKDSTQTFTLTIVLKNAGELPGVVSLVIKEGSKTINTQNVTVDGLGSKTLTVSWSVKGDAVHTATATITGAGTTGTATAKATLHYTPGFEVLFLVAAIIVAAVLIRRRK